MHVGRYHKYFLLIFVISCFLWLLIIIFKESAVFMKDDKSVEDPYEQLQIDRTVFGIDMKMELAKKFNAPLPMPDKVAAGLRFNASCAKYTPPMKISFSNIYWQVLEMSSSKVTYFMYGAYFDNRLTTGAVRVVAFLTKLVDNDTRPHCQLWFEGLRKPVIVKALLLVMYRKDLSKKIPIIPYLVTCKIPPRMSGKVPASVSLVETQCEEATNNLRVIYNPLTVGETKKDFLVCVKALFFPYKPHMAVRIVEWIELLKILGAQKFVIYNFQAHENITSVLDYYSSNENFEHVPVTLPGKFPNYQHLISDFLSQHNWIQYLNDIVQVTDCMYRHLYKFNYVTTLDVDEVIVPISKDNWHDLIYDVAVPKAAQQNKSFAGFVSKNTFFLDDQIEQQAWYPDIPKYMHMLQNVHRKDFYYPVNHTRKHSKAFFDVDKNLYIFCHYPMECVANECDYLIFDPVESQLQHYCVGQGRRHSDCKNNSNTDIVQDTSLWKYKDELVAKTSKVLKETGFLK